MESNLKNEFALIFDLDGTLWDSSKEVASSWDQTIRRRHPNAPAIKKEDMIETMGLTMNEIAERLIYTRLGHVDHDLALLAFKEENDYLIEHPGRHYPHLEETLKKLKNKYRLLIASNCQLGYIEAFLHSLNDNYFSDWISWGETQKSKGENVIAIMKRQKVKKAIFIGDTLKDYEAAEYAAIPFIHASYGFGSLINAKYRIADLEELPSLVEDVFKNETK